MNRLQKSITVPSETKYIRKAVCELLDFVNKSIKLDEDELPLVLSEALANGIIHGNKRNPGKKVKAQVTIKPDKLVFDVADEGKGFDYNRFYDPRKCENLCKRTGRGNFLIRYFMDEVHYNKIGNKITMVKYLH